jgi:hypothetical protein
MPDHVNVVDARAPADAHRYAQRELSVYIRVDESWSMDHIARRIVERATGGIGVVRFICHGNSGRVWFGSGLTAGTAAGFQLLGGHFTGEHPRIEVHACAVLSGTSVDCGPVQRDTSHSVAGFPRDFQRCLPGTIVESGPGHVIMQALANAAGVTVVAAYNVQWTDPELALEGTVRYFHPAQP